METLANPSVPFIQFLNEHGQVTRALPKFAQQPDTLLELYRWLTLTRLFDAKAVKLQRTGRLGTYPSSLGQEAVAVGMGYALTPEDVFCPVYREHGTQLMRGVTMTEILSYWGGDERGNHFKHAQAQQDLPNCVPLATQCLHAAGIATAIKLRKQRRAVLVVCGDGATSRGDFYEAINLAGAWQLPLVVLINNNQWAISVPRRAQTGAHTLAQKGIASGIPNEQVDGNDVIAVAQQTRLALERARQGQGPTILEAITYRLADHTTADDATRYRDPKEVSAAWEKEPLKRLQRYLYAQSLWNTEKEQALQQTCQAQVEAATAEYLQQPPQPPTTMFDYLYAELPHAFTSQYQELSDV